MSGDAGNILRTFIAIDLPAPVLDALATTQDQLQKHLRGAGCDRAVRWSPVKNLHLTLRFLGDTNARQREQVVPRLQAVAAKVKPFTLAVDVSGRGLGGFPNLRQPRVLWSGVGGDTEQLGQLQAQVEAAVQAVGFAPEEKGFSPHLTLARGAREADRRALGQVGQAVGDFAQSAFDAEWMEFQVDRLIFYQSQLAAGGARYTSLAVFPFAGV